MAELKLVYRTLRKFSEWAVDGYYSQVVVEGKENVSKDAPLIIASTHHNEIIDIAALAATIPHRRHLSFWAKSTMFANPVMDAILTSSGAIPVKRNPNSSGPPPATTSEGSVAAPRHVPTSGRPQPSDSSIGKAGPGPSSSMSSSKRRSAAAASSHSTPTPAVSRSALFDSTSETLSKRSLTSNGANREGVVGVFPEGTSYTEARIVQILQGAAWAGVEYVKWVSNGGGQSRGRDGAYRGAGNGNGQRAGYGSKRNISGNGGGSGGGQRQDHQQLHRRPHNHTQTSSQGRKGKERETVPPPNGSETGLKIIPVAIVYTDKSSYLSRVLVKYGGPIHVDAYTRDVLNAKDDVEADEAAKRVVREMTETLEAKLRAMTINASDWDTLCAASMARNILWEDEDRIDLEEWVTVSQRLVQLFELPAGMEPAHPLVQLKKILIKYYAYLKHTGMTHTTLASLLPFPHPRAYGGHNPTSLSPSALPTLATFPILDQATSSLLTSLPVSLLQLALFLPPMILHIPAYLSGYLAGKLLVKDQREEEAKAQFKAIVGGLGLAGSVGAAWRWLWVKGIREVAERRARGGGLGGISGEVRIPKMGFGAYLRLASVIYGSVWVMVKWHGLLVKPNHRTLQRFLTYGKLVYGFLFPSSSFASTPTPWAEQMRKKALNQFAVPPRPAFNPFIKRNAKSLTAPTTHERPRHEKESKTKAVPIPVGLGKSAVVAGGSGVGVTLSPPASIAASASTSPSSSFVASGFISPKSSQASVVESADESEAENIKISIQSPGPMGVAAPPESDAETVKERGAQHQPRTNRGISHTFPDDIFGDDEDEDDKRPVKLSPEVWSMLVREAVHARREACVALWAYLRGVGGDELRGFVESRGARVPSMTWGCFTNPRQTPHAIPCGHIFCYSCLLALEGAGLPSCPLCRKTFQPHKAKKLHVDKPENVDDHKETDLLQRMAVSWEVPLDQLTELMMEVDAWLSGRADDACVALRRCRTALSRHLELKASAREHETTVKDLTEQVKRLNDHFEFERTKYQATEDAQIDQITKLANENTRLSHESTQLADEITRLKDELETVKNLNIRLQVHLTEAQTHYLQQPQIRNPLPPPPQPIPYDQLPTLAQAAAEPKYSSLFTSTSNPPELPSEAEHGKRHRRRKDKDRGDKDKERDKDRDRERERVKGEEGVAKERRRPRGSSREPEQGRESREKGRDKDRAKERRPHYATTDEEILLTSNSGPSSSQAQPANPTTPDNVHPPSTDPTSTAPRIHKSRSRYHLTEEFQQPQPAFNPSLFAEQEAAAEPVIDSFALASVYLKEYTNGLISGHMAATGQPMPMTPGPIVRPDPSTQGGGSLIPSPASVGGEYNGLGVASGSGLPQPAGGSGGKKSRKANGREEESRPGTSMAGMHTPSRPSGRTRVQPAAGGQESIQPTDVTPPRQGPNGATAPANRTSRRDRSNSHGSRSRERHLPPRLVAPQHSLSSSTGSSASLLFGGHAGVPPPPVPPLPDSYGSGQSYLGGLVPSMAQSTSSLLTSSSSGGSTVRPAAPPTQGHAQPQAPPASAPPYVSNRQLPPSAGMGGGAGLPPLSAPLAGPVMPSGPNGALPVAPTQSNNHSLPAPPSSAPLSRTDTSTNNHLNPNPPVDPETRHRQRMSIASTTSANTWGTIPSERSNLTEGSLMSGLRMFTNDYETREGGVPPELGMMTRDVNGAAGGQGNRTGAPGPDGIQALGAGVGLGLTFDPSSNASGPTGHGHLQPGALGRMPGDEQTTPSSRRISIYSGGNSVRDGEHDDPRGSLVLGEEIMSGERMYTMSPDQMGFFPPGHGGGRGRVQGAGSGSLQSTGSEDGLGLSVARSGSPARRIETMEGVLPSGTGRSQGHLLSHGRHHQQGTSGSTVVPNDSTGTSSTTPGGHSSNRGAAPTTNNAFSNPFYPPSNPTQQPSTAPSNNPPPTAPATNMLNRFYRSSTSMDIRPPISSSHNIYSTTSRNHLRNGSNVASSASSAFRLRDEDGPAVDDFGYPAGIPPMAMSLSRSQHGGYQTDVEAVASSHHRRDRERRDRDRDRDRGHRNEPRDRDRERDRERDRDRDRSRRDRDPHRARPGRVLPLPEGSPFPITDENAEEEEAATRDAQIQQQQHAQPATQTRPPPMYNLYTPHPYPAPPPIQQPAPRSQGDHPTSPGGAQNVDISRIYGNPLRSAPELGAGQAQGTPVPSRRHQQQQQQQQAVGGVGSTAAIQSTRSFQGNALGLDLSTASGGGHAGVGISAPTPAPASGTGTQGFLRNWNREG